jgi:TRAP-type C4-dicarboxylate transport system substrate-binding protein
MKKFTKAAMFLTAVSIGLVGCGQAKTKTAEIPSRESSQGEKQKDVGTGEDSAAEGKYDLSGVEPITLSVTSALSLNHGCWVGFYVPFMEKVTEASQGLVTFEVYSAGELVEGGKEYDALREGVIDIAAPLTPIYDASRFPTSDVGQLPLKVSNAVIATRAYELMLESQADIDNGKTYRQREFEDNGIHFMVHNIPAGATINTTGKTLADIGSSAGISMRTSSRAGQIFVTEVGMTPISMAAYDLYDALSRGAIDGALIHVADWPAYGLQDILKYSITDASYGHFVAGCAMTRDRWDSLPPVIQQIMEDVAGECRISGAEYWDEQTIAVMEEGKANGIDFVSFNDLSAETQEQLNQAAVKTWEEYIKMQEEAGVPGKAIVKLWADCVKEAGGELYDGVADLLNQ